MNESLCVVLTTFDDEGIARECAGRLVEERLVACAQVGTAPVHAIYRWQGRVEAATEWRVVLKLPVRSVSAVRERLLELHSYQNPQFVVLDATASAQYARWVDESCT